MKKFITILIILISSFLIYATVDSIVISYSKDYLKYNLDKYENPTLDNLEGSSRQDYFDYINKKEQFFPKNKEIVLNHSYVTEVNGYDEVVLSQYEGVENPLLTDEVGSTTWTFDVDESGFYNIDVNYFPYAGKSSSIERTILINGEIPFSAVNNVVFPRVWGNDGDIREDIFGNDIRPSQVEKPRWTKSTIKDPLGYITEDFRFYFEEGVNNITFISKREPLLIDNLVIKSIKQVGKYEDIKKLYEQNKYEVVGTNPLLFEAETFSHSTSPTIYPLSNLDPATSPNNTPNNIKLNTIGGANWNIAGDSISWKFRVEKTGLHNISLRVRQNLASGISAGRKIYINNEILFDELQNYSFKESRSWRIQTLGTSEEPFYFYFEEGVDYEFKMEVSLGQYGQVISNIEGSIESLSKLYREIIKFTGPSPDPNRDYLLLSRIPNLNELLQEERDNLNQVRDEIIEISGSKSEKTGILDTMIFQLDDFIKKPNDIHKKISSFSSNISSLGTLLILLSSSPLEIDCFYVHGTNMRGFKQKSNMFSSLWFTTRLFINSFFIDYSAVGTTTTDDSNDKIEVWLSVGKDQSNILRKLIDESFTPNSNINVDLKLVSSAALLPATLSGKGPDVALGVGSNVPVNYALRNAAVDLTKFEGYEEVMRRFHDSALVPFSFNDGIYALPEQQMFLMMFYRTDIFEEYGLKVPNTWDELILSIIDLQKYNLEFYLPVPVSEGAVVNLPPNPIFSTMFYQNNGEFYLNDNKESGFAHGKGPEIFERWTEFYTDYSFPVDANFANRFRSGQMPIGISYYNTYNTLSVFAPEIRGKWDFALVPGTKAIDENGEEYIRRDTVSTGTGAIMLEGTKKEQQSWEFLKWWTSTATQIRFGREMEGILGAAARYPTANVEAMKSLPWRVQELNMLQEQWDWVKGIPEVPGSYMTGRHLDNAFRLVINDNANPREAIYDYVQTINLEIIKKREEFGLSTGR